MALKELTALTSLTSGHRHIQVSTNKHALTGYIEIIDAAHKIPRLQCRADVTGEVNESVGVTPLIVIPTQHLGTGTHYRCQ